MTVQELMLAMVAAYKGMDQSAVSALGPVFKQKLEKYEGKELAAAWVEVASGFDAKPSKPYPLPKDFELVLPAARKMPSGPRLDREAHAKRKADLVSGWIGTQKRAIGTQYGPRVAFWCESEVRARADSLAWRPEPPIGITLSSNDVERIFQSVVSRYRIDTFGYQRNVPADLWTDQMVRCGELVRAGQFSRDALLGMPVGGKSTGKNPDDIPISGWEPAIGTPEHDNAPPWDDGAVPE